MIIDFADQFGGWKTLGSIAPNTLSWQVFPKDAANSQVFRATFDTNWAWWEREEKFRFRSFGLLMEEYKPVGKGVANALTTQICKKIILQKESLLFKIEPLPFNFDTQQIERQLKIKRRFWSPQNWELTQPALDIPWSVNIQAMEPN